MSLKNDLNQSVQSLRSDLDGENIITIEENDIIVDDFTKFSAFGEKIDNSNISETPEDGMLPIYTKNDEDDIILNANSFEIINEDYHIDFKYVSKTVNDTGTIAIGVKDVTISSDLSKVKLLGVSFNITDNFGTAPDLITVEILNSSDTIIYSFTVLDSIGLTKHLFDSFNYDDKIVTPKLKFKLNVNAVSAGSIDVVFIYETVEGGEWV